MSQSMEIYEDGELVETRTIVPRPTPPDPVVARIAELEAKIGDVAEGVEVSLDPGAPQGRREALRARIRDLFGLAESADVAAPKTTPGREVRR
jgi:hypothetical protein